MKWNEGKKETSLLEAINVVIAMKNPKELPRGIEKFKVFGRIGNAFAEAEKTGELVLEESDYDFLKKTIEQDVPSQWAMNKDIRCAVEAFLEAKEE